MRPCSFVANSDFPLVTALEGLTESLASELDSSWNIKVSATPPCITIRTGNRPSETEHWQITLINPASFRTEGQAKTTWAPPHPAYSGSNLPTTRMRSGWGSYVPSGDVNKAVEVIYKLASELDPPLHFLLGEVAHMYAKQKIAMLTSEVEKYASWSENLKKDRL